MNSRLLKSNLFFLFFLAVLIMTFPHTLNAQGSRVISVVNCWKDNSLGFDYSNVTSKISVFGFHALQNFNPYLVNQYGVITTIDEVNERIEEVYSLFKGSHYMSGALIISDDGGSRPPLPPTSGQSQRWSIPLSSSS